MDYSEPRLENVTIDNNCAEYGSGIYIRIGYYDGPGPMIQNEISLKKLRVINNGCLTGSRSNSAIYFGGCGSI